MPRIIDAGSGPDALARAASALGLAILPSAPLSAIGAGVSLAHSDLVFHCDLVRVAGGLMVEAPAAIESAAESFERLTPIAARLTMDLTPIGGARALLIYRGGWPFDVRTHDPSLLVGRPVSEHSPYGAGDEVLLDLMETSAAALGDGLMVWPWGGATLPRIGRINPPGTLIGPAAEIGGLARLIGWHWAPQATIPSP